MFDGIQIDPVAFTLPYFDRPIFWYGIIVTLGIAIGAWWAGREIVRRGQSIDELYNGLLIVVVVGFLGARVTYVALDMLGDNPAAYDTLWDVFNIGRGGLNIIGGFFAALVVAYMFVRWRKLSFWHYADVAGPAILIGQGIGRWANFINQELYGPPTDAPWGLLIDDANNRIRAFSDFSEFPLGTRFHPTFLYESILLLVGFAILVILNNRNRGKWPAGVIFGLFLMWWGIGRFIIEFFRPDQTSIGSSPITYSMIGVLILALMGLYIVLHRFERLPQALQRGRSRNRVYKPKPRRES